MAIYSVDVLLFNIEPVHCPMSSSNCCFLTGIQVSQESGKVVWYSPFFKNFQKKKKKEECSSLLWSTQRLYMVKEAEGDVLLELSCFLHDPTSISNLITGSSASLKPSLYIWKFSLHVLLKPGLKDFEHSLASMWDKSNCTVVWTFFALPFFGFGMKTDLF